MQLTEEQVLDNQELFFSIMDNWVNENYEIDEDYEPTDEDNYIFSLVMDHFVYNYRIPTIMESHLEDITGYDINTPLYEEMMETLLDESVGTFVAGAVHGIRNTFSGIKADSAREGKEKAKKGFEKHLANPGSKSKPKFKVDDAQKAHEKTNFGTGAYSDAKKAFGQAKLDAQKQRALKAQQAMKSAEAKRKSALGKHQSNVAKTGQLANKIDTGISNIKNKTKQAISAGASRIGGFLGKVAGRLAPV